MGIDTSAPVVSPERNRQTFERSEVATHILASPEARTTTHERAMQKISDNAVFVERLRELAQQNGALRPDMN